MDVIPIGRGSVGADFTLAPDPARAIDLASAFGGGADVLFGAAPTLVVAPEGAYVFDAGAGGVHLFDLGCGVGLGDPRLFVAYHPHLLVGGGGDAAALAIGTRQGAALHAWFDILSAEVGYQMVSQLGEPRQGIYVVFGGNVASAIQQIVAAFEVAAR